MAGWVCLRCSQVALADVQQGACPYRLGTVAGRKGDPDRRILWQGKQLPRLYSFQIGIQCGCRLSFQAISEVLVHLDVGAYSAGLQSQRRGAQ